MARCSAFSASSHCSGAPSYLPLAPPSQVEISAVVLVEPEGAQRVDRELQAIDDLVLDLLGRAEDMRVVLREAADAEQSVQHARPLVAVHRAQLAEPHGQVAVAVLPVRVDQDVERAVHRLELVFGVVQLHAA